MCHNAKSIFPKREERIVAHIDYKQLVKVRDFLKELPEGGVEGVPFCVDGPYAQIFSDVHPPLNHEQAVNFFFYLTSQNYGFWYGDERGYVQPLFGQIKGKQVKGSEALHRALKSALDKDAMIFEPHHLAIITPRDLAYLIFADDNGSIPFPDFETRFQLTRAYGRWFAEHKTTPQGIVETANKELKPLAAFLEIIRQIPGYDTDTFEKKNMLLAMALASRPEKFLDVRDSENWGPVVDYHLMRIPLRMGLVKLDKDEVADNVARRWVLPNIEEHIRAQVHGVFRMLMQESGKSAFYIDQIFWWGRKFCPEMEEPTCAACVLKPACLQRTELFQPVFRTDAY